MATMKQMTVRKNMTFHQVSIRMFFHDVKQATGNLKRNFWCVEERHTKSYSNIYKWQPEDVKTILHRDKKVTKTLMPGLSLSIFSYLRSQSTGCPKTTKGMWKVDYSFFSRQPSDIQTCMVFRRYWPAQTHTHFNLRK